MTETNTTGKIDTAESVIRSAAVNIGMMDMEDHKSIVDTICENMKKEYVVKEWQLLELNESQWKELGVPIGLRVAIRSSCSSSAVDSGEISQQKTDTIASSVASTAAAASTTTTTPNKTTKDRPETQKKASATSAQSRINSKKRKRLSSPSTVQSSTNVRATITRNVDEKNKDDGDAASVTNATAIIEGNEKMNLLTSSSQPETKTSILRSNLRRAASTTTAVDSKGKLTAEEEFQKIVASIDRNNNNELATRNLRSMTKQGSPYGNRNDNSSTCVQDTSSSKDSRIPITPAKSMQLVIDGATSSRKRPAATTTTATRSSQRMARKNSCTGQLSPDTTTTTTVTTESSQHRANKVTPNNDQMAHKTIPSTSSSSTTRKNIASDVETSKWMAKRDRRVLFEDNLPKKGVPKKIVLHPIGAPPAGLSNPHLLPSERNKVINEFVLRWNHRRGASSSPPSPKTSRRRRFRRLPLAKNKTRSNTSSVYDSDAITGADTKSITKKKKESSCFCEYEGKPTETNIVGGTWPDGWIKRVYVRNNGATKGVHDRYWYSPIKKFKLRSMVQVNKFITELNDCNGDEVRAYKKFITMKK